jgi:hypothetical protein
MARPTIYSEALANEICEWIAKGGSLNAYCKQPNTPSMSAVMGWLFTNKQEGFVEKYTRAREAQAEVLADEIIAIADGDEHDTIITEDGIQKNREVIERSRIKIDARKWVAAKLLPKKYGDKLEINDVSKAKTLVMIVTDGDIDEPDSKNE